MRRFCTAALLENEYLKSLFIPDHYVVVAQA